MKKLLNHPIVKTLLKAQFILALIIYATLSLITLPNTGKEIPFDFLHVVGNIILYVSGGLALIPKHSAIRVFLLLLPYSLGVEFLQSINPNRFTDIADMGANILGLSIGLILFSVSIKIISALKREVG